MDLYTSSFGKLQKQKEGNIATISRERQKIIDQNNSAIRRGMGKSSSNASLLNAMFGGQADKIKAAAQITSEHFNEAEMGKAKNTAYLAFSQQKYDRGVPAGGTKNVKENMVVGNIQDEEQIEQNRANSSDPIQSKEGKNDAVPLVSNDPEDNAILQPVDKSPGATDEGIPRAAHVRPDRE